MEKVDARVASNPLAGSARRRKDADADRRAAASLFGSEKDRREHATVVEWIADRLAPHCRRLRVPREPSLVSTQTMWHLGTRIEGELRDPTEPSLRLVADLHPTPAVCGLPGDLARTVIAELEPFDRGFFAGAVGWCDARGDGRWLLTLRCAELSGSTARLYAGAGIVPGSRPTQEAAETSAKFAAMLRAFGIDEEGHPVTEEE
jgi:isochorismate synthase